MNNTREKLIELLYKAHGLATEASCFKDATYAQQLEVEADHLIANGVGFLPKWIPVTERLPEQYQSVIVWTSDKELGEAEHDGKHFRWTYDDEYANVTHWMPLPEPPGGVKE